MYVPPVLDDAALHVRSDLRGTRVRADVGDEVLAVGIGQDPLPRGPLASLHEVIMSSLTGSSGCGRPDRADPAAPPSPIPSPQPVNPRRRPGILAYMPTEHGPAIPGPDDFDRQLRDLTSGSAGAARFREPSAEERARQAAQRRPRQRTTWRGAGKARKLRKPPSTPPPARRGLWGRPTLKVVGGRSSARPARSARRARLLSIAKMAAILIGFAGLLIVLHLLGLGPH